MKVALLVALAACETQPGVSTFDAGALPRPPSGAHHHYVANHVGLDAVGFDLDGDGRPDNRFGRGLAALVGAGIDIQGAMDRAIADGSIILLIDLQAGDFVDAVEPAGLTVLFGEQPSPSPCVDASDVACGRHLDGRGSFARVPVSSMWGGNGALVGPIAGGVFTSDPARPPWMSLRLAIVGEVPIQFRIEDAQVVASGLATDGLGAITLAGALELPFDWDFDTTSIVGGLAPELETMIASTCTRLASPPGCGCPDGSTAAKLIAFFDSQPDCRITRDEIRASAFDAGADLQLGSYAGISFAVTLTAVPAQFDDGP